MFLFCNVAARFAPNGQQLLTLGSKPSAALSAVKKLVKGSKNLHLHHQPSESNCLLAFRWLLYHYRFL
jgi:hypothetical protein